MELKGKIRKKKKKNCKTHFGGENGKGGKKQRKKQRAEFKIELVSLNYKKKRRLM
jgi:hypothetical protein